jgi:hypothetical protein
LLKFNYTGSQLVTLSRLTVNVARKIRS